MKDLETPCNKRRFISWERTRRRIWRV